MNLYVIATAIAILLIFFILNLRTKILLAFFVTSQCFDLTQGTIYGKHIWDYGSMLLMIAAVPLTLKWVSQKREKRKTYISSNLYLLIIIIFIIWMFLCLLYSLLIYNYPVLDTLKASRQMIIGYVSVFVFIGLFILDDKAFDMFIKWLYIITFPLLIVTIIQQIVGESILFGTQREYARTLRYLPAFLPISLMYKWNILSRFFSGEKVKVHSLIYAFMTAIVTALTFTRGYYFAVMFGFTVMLFLLFIKGRIKVERAIAFVLAVSVCVTIFIASGLAENIIKRAYSGIEILLSKRIQNTKTDQDTFTGRLLLTKERFELVSKHNPIVGFGFIHEKNISHNLRKGIRYGSIVSTPEMVKEYKFGHPYVLAIYSADIGWPNIVLSTGFVGFFIFITFIGLFILSYKKLKIMNKMYEHYHLAFYIQIITIILTMFNGSRFTTQVQIPALMIAGYYYCNRQQNETSAKQLRVQFQG